MAQDLRNLFEKDLEVQSAKMSEGHEARFLDKLEQELPEKKSTNYFGFFRIAASVVVLLGLGYAAFNYFGGPTETGGVEPQVVETSSIKTMGEYSPELKKVEDFYLASINLELSKVQLTPENKGLVDGYIQRLKELNDEYDKLTVELNEDGPNAITLDALINNLKLRLNLVTRLKDKLEEFNNEDFVEESI